jgi:hypothetical protein
MIAQASGLGVAVGRFSRPLREVELIAMPDAGLNTMRQVEVPLGAGVRRLLIPSMAIGVFIDRRCAEDGVEVQCRVISATLEVLSDNEGVEC